jgi:type III pantothenate kinase
MLLAMDVGNTHTVLGLFSNSELVQHWRVRTVREGTADEYGVLVRALCRDDSGRNRRLDGIVIASVIPPLKSVLQEMGENFFNVAPVFVTAENLPGIEVLYQEPRDVGADRVVNAVAALEKHEPPLIIVDFGTAITFDVINERGEYAGGSIAPGIGISLQALYQRAARLRSVDLVCPLSVVGKNTEESIQSGVLYGYASLVEGMVARISNEMEKQPVVIVTGGYAPLMAPVLDSIDFVDTDLTLKGLLIAYQRLTQR